VHVANAVYVAARIEQGAHGSMWTPPAAAQCRG
jgi:hypothetical protein